MERQEIEYDDENEPLKGSFFSLTPQTKKPVVILFSTWKGKTPYICSRAEQIAKLGYHTFVADVFGEGKSAELPAECSALMMPFMEDREKLKKRLLTTVKIVKTLPFVDSQKIAVAGFCFGGLCALDLARSGEPLSGAISFHGLLNPPNLSPKEIQTKILVMHGDIDPMVSTEELEAFKKEMRTKKANWELIIFGNTYHAFTNPDENDKARGTVYSEIVEKRAFKRLEFFLEEIFV